MPVSGQEVFLWPGKQGNSFHADTAEARGADTPPVTLKGICTNPRGLSIYLDHFLILAILVDMMKQLPIPGRAGGVLVAAITAVARYELYRNLEAPLLKKARSF